MRAGWVRSAVVALFVLVGSPALPAQAATLLLVPCGASITHAGVYRVGRATTSCTADGIVIQASHVVVDLGGRVLHGDFSHTGIKIDPGFHHIVVRNGTITNFGTGIESPGRNTFSRVMLVANSTSFSGTTDVVSRSVSTFTAGAGLTFDGSGRAFGNTAVLNAGDGIDSKGLVVGNVAAGNGFNGITDSDGSVSRNLSVGNGSSGIAAGPNGVVRNRAIGNYLNGISQSPADGTGFMTGNTVLGNRGLGAFVSHTGRARFNRFVGNGDSGISLGLGPNDVKDNIASGNLGDGVKGLNDHVFRNVADGNTGLGVQEGATATGAGTNKAVENIGGLSGQCDPATLCVPHRVRSRAQVVDLGDCTVTHVINAPGTYRLKHSVEDCSATPAVQISSSNVVLDLSGRVIDGAGAFSAGVSVDSGLTDVVVRNGVVSDWLLGVLIQGNRSVATGIMARDNAVGIAASFGARVVACTTTLNDTGIGAQDDGTTVSRNLVAGNNQSGILSSGGAVRIIGNRVFGNNVTDAPDAPGIEADGAAFIANNSVIGNFDDGIKTINGATITANRVAANKLNGINVGDDDVVTRNVVTGNVHTGIITGQRPTIVANKVFGNGGGILTGGSATLVANVASGNRANGIQSGPSADIRRNIANGNVDHGIFASPPLSGGRNSASLNGFVDCSPSTIC